jgi:hypothetical protein
MSFVVGLSLGQQRDQTAIAVIEETDGNRFEVGHFERWRAESIPELVASLEAFLPALPRKDKLSSVSLAIDATEIGRPVVEMIRHAKTRANVYSIAVTGGDSDSREGWQIWLPERNLLSNLTLLLQTGKLTIVRDLPLASSLKKDFEGLRAKASTIAEDSRADWRRDQDGLVVAVSLAAWIAEKNNAWAFSMKAWLKYTKKGERETSW